MVARAAPVLKPGRLTACWLAVAGCWPMATMAAPPDPVETVMQLREQDHHILTLGRRLAIAGKAFCRDVSVDPGWQLQTLGQYGPDYRPAARQVLALGEEPTIAWLAPDGPAARAGLRLGDRLLAADGMALAIEPPRADRASYAGIAQTDRLLEAALADGAAILRLRRGDTEFAAAITGSPGCRARFEVRASRSQGASADGAIVQISSGLVAATASDGELAAVLAHELAHNILRHPQRLRGEEKGLKERDTEVAADRLSVYLLDAAGLSTADAAGFWRRWGKARSLGIFADGSHPGWRTRAATIEAEAAAIAAQRAAGVPVVPPAALRP